MQQKNNIVRGRATMVVDAMNLYKICFEGVKSYALQQSNLHAVWGFMKKLRGLLNENINNHTYQISRVILFWDGPESGKLRRDIYPEYKEKRNRFFNGIDPYYQQKEKIVELMRLLGIESYEHPFIEADDCIAEYVRQNKDKEHIIILSNDNDYFQLIDKNVHIFYLNRIQIKEHIYPKNLLINAENFEYYFEQNYKNILLKKIIIGDESDNIVGAKGFSEKSILNEVPMFIKREYDRNTLLEYALKQQAEKNRGKRLQVLIDFLKDDDRYNLSETLINLKSKKFITEECTRDIENILPLPLDLKGFYSTLKSEQYKLIHKQIMTDPDFDGDVRNFSQPFLLTNKFKKNE